MTGFKSPAEVPPPKPDDYMRAIEETIKADHIQTGRDVMSAYVAYEARNSQYTDYMHAALRVGEAIEPYDRSTEQPFDPSQKIAQAVVRGMAFGRLFVPRAHDQSVDLGQLVPVYPSGINDIPDRMERNHALGGFFVKTGEQGADIMSSEALDQLDALSPGVIPDVSSERFFTIGCGVVAYTALHAHAKFNNNASFEHLSKQGFTADWDSELAKLLN